jgi:hypothetical protein
VKAYGIGNKIKDGIRHNDYCISVYVKRKLDKKCLSREAKLPKSIAIGNNKYVLIDVRIYGKPRNHSASSAIEVGADQGCLGGYYFKDNKLFGITAGHTLLDGELNMYGSTIKIFYPESWKTIGVARRVLYERGTPTASSKGMRDYGELEVVENQDALIRANVSYKVWIPTSESDYIDLIGKAVYSNSYLSNTKHAIVDNVRYHDVQMGNTVGLKILKRDSDRVGISRRGDSGKIWRLSDTEMPLALHFAGNNTGNTYSSTAYACFLFDCLGDSINRIFL